MTDLDMSDLDMSDLDMTDAFTFASWFFISIAVPLLAPVVLLPLMRFSTTFRAKSDRVLFRSIRDGQLLWTVIAMSAASCHAATELIGQDLPQWKVRLVWTLFSVDVVLLCMAAATVLIKTAEASQHRDERADHALVQASIGGALVSAVIFAALWIIAH